MEHTNASVLALFIADATTKKTIAVDEILCDCHGIKGDKHYGKNPDRSVLLTSTYAYELAKNENIQMQYGMLGENILVDFDLKNLKPGDRLRLGKVVVEVAQNCTLCNHLAQIDKKLPKLLRTDRGIFTRVITGGRLHPQDEVSLIA